MPDKIHMSVVRDAGYKRGEFGTRGRHNERKNAEYGNGDIEPERTHLNEHFHQNFTPDGEAETYEETYNRLLADGKISEKWQKPDSAQFAEMVLDVNTEYFDERGGYEYARTFFEEAYRFALKEIGSEEYIISAVLHADERNSKLSEQLGRDVYYYHLHVVYVPVVEKRDYFSKDYKKDPALAGKLKEVYMQVAHSKKWPIKLPYEKDGKKFYINSYSLLQDRYFEHMRAAGFEGFERGERGSTAEHLSDLEYKTKQETERLTETAAAVRQREQSLSALEEKEKKKKKQLEAAEAKLTVAKQDSLTFSDIDGMSGNRTMLGGKIILSADDWEKVSAFAKSGVKFHSAIVDLKKKNSGLSQKNADLEKRLESYEGRNIDGRMKYHQAAQRAPRRLAETVADILRKPPETAEPDDLTRQRNVTNREVR